MPQYQSITGRRPQYNWSDLIRADAPRARQRYFNNLSLKQSEDQFDQSLALNQEQLDFQRQQAEESQKQAAQSQLLSEAGLAIEAAPYIKSGFTKASPLIKDTAGGAIDWAGSLFSPSTSGVGTAAEGANLIGGGTAGYTTGVQGVAEGANLVGGGTDLLLADTAAQSAPVAQGAASGVSAGATGAGTATESASGISGTLGTIGNVLAVIALQNMAADATKTNFEGQRSGGFFSMNDEGNWNPRFFNDPWKGYTNQQAGLGPSSGEKLDAAMYNQDYGKVAKRLPSTLNQWSDPIGDLGYDITKKGVQQVTGLGDQEADAAMMAINPIGGAVKAAEDSWLCTEVGKRFKYSLSDIKALIKLKKYSIDNHKYLTKHYLNHGPELIDSIGMEKSVYTELYMKLIGPVIQLVKREEMEQAFELYRDITIKITRAFAPHLCP